MSGFVGLTQKDAVTPVDGLAPLAVSYTSDDTGKPINLDAMTLAYTYDASGNTTLITATDPNNGVDVWEKASTYSATPGSNVLLSKGPWVYNYYARSHQLQNAGHAWSYAYSSLTGEHRFEVRDGDVWVSDPSYAERSEITDLAPQLFNHTMTVHYRIMIEAGVPNLSDRVVIGQFHETPDGGDLGVSPCFALELKYERMRAFVRYTKDAVTVRQPVETLLFMDATDIARNRWYDITINIRFDPTGNGYCQILRDGVQLAEYKGPVGSNDAIGPYWKMGIYRASYPQTLAVRYKQLSINQFKA